MQALQQQLAVEIEFWREMIEQQDTPFPPESLERMKQALALAEHKLLLLGPVTGSSAHHHDADADPAGAIGMTRGSDRRH